ncbi:MAG: hypothetical protein AB7K63_19670 [Vicinamibacterales bacterium]
MLLDKPGRFLYKNHVDLYPAMRAFCCDYCYIVCGTVAATVALLTWVLSSPATLRFLGISE